MRPENRFFCYAPKDGVRVSLESASKWQSLVTPPELPPRIQSVHTAAPSTPPPVCRPAPRPGHTLCDSWGCPRASL